MDMKYSVKIFEKSFSDEVSKDAYLKACKWLAKNLYSKDELAEMIHVNVKKEESQLPTFVVSLYLVNDENECKECHCKKCRTISTVFYQVEKPDCDHCKMNAYMKRKERWIEDSANYYERYFNEEVD